MPLHDRYITVSDSWAPRRRYIAVTLPLHYCDITVSGALEVGEEAGDPQPARRVGAQPHVQPLASHVEPEPNAVAEGRPRFEGRRALAVR